MEHHTTLCVYNLTIMKSQFHQIHLIFIRKRKRDSKRDSTYTVKSRARMVTTAYVF